MSSTSKLVTNSLNKLHWDFVDRRGYLKFHPQILTHSDFKPLAINMVHKFEHIIMCGEYLLPSKRIGSRVHYVDKELCWFTLFHQSLRRDGRRQVPGWRAGYETKFSKTRHQQRGYCTRSCKNVQFLYYPDRFWIVQIFSGLFGQFSDCFW